MLTVHEADCREGINAGPGGGRGICSPMQPYMKPKTAFDDAVNPSDSEERPGVNV
jgi:hypothetical protein